MICLLRRSSRSSRADHGGARLTLGQFIDPHHRHHDVEPIEDLEPIRKVPPELIPPPKLHRPALWTEIPTANPAFFRAEGGFQKGTLCCFASFDDERVHDVVEDVASDKRLGARIFGLDSCKIRRRQRSDPG